MTAAYTQEGIEQKARELGREIKQRMPEGVGFCLVLYELGPGGPELRTFLSSGERAGVGRSMLELARKVPVPRRRKGKWTGKAHALTPELQAAAEEAAVLSGGIDDTPGGLACKELGPLVGAGVRSFGATKWFFLTFDFGPDGRIHHIGNDAPAGFVTALNRFGRLLEGN